MGKLSKIEWTDHTFNPWIGCQKVSPGCDFCYAEDMMDKRYGRVRWGPHGERLRTSAGNWAKPRAWAKHAGRFAELHGRRQRVFCASLADVFDNKAPPGAFTDLMWLIHDTPELDWLLAMADHIGVTRKWLQQPPKASWVHFDIALSKRALAVKAGAVEITAREMSAWEWHRRTFGETVEPAVALPIMLERIRARGKSVLGRAAG